VARVLIVAKTRMSNGVCIGGLTRDGNKNVRLIPPNRRNHPADTLFDVGQVWDLDFHPSLEITSPHVEDVIVTKERYITQIPNLLETLLERVQPWQGNPEQLFDGLLTFVESGKGYISQLKGLPNSSTGFWLPNRPLDKITSYGKTNYIYNSPFGRFYLPYVGLASPIDQIPNGTLIRVSLARWWAPDGTNDKKCYLQLSGWYL
jgi:hypothetical protein